MENGSGCQNERSCVGNEVERHGKYTGLSRCMAVCRNCRGKDMMWRFLFYVGSEMFKGTKDGSCEGLCFI